MELLNYLFCDMFGGILECYELTHVLPQPDPPGSHAWVGIVTPLVVLGDNDRAARVLFVQHPREQGEWCSQNPSVARVLT